jgi:hypothetical protein
VSLLDYTWTQEDLSTTEYAGKYVTHDPVSKHSVVDQLEGENDLELGEHTLEYGGEKMDVRLDVNSRWAVFFYDETFEEELGEEDFGKVLTYFLTPDRWKDHSDIHPEE